MKNIVLIGGSTGIGAALIEKLKDSAHLWVAGRQTQPITAAGVKTISLNILEGDPDPASFPETIDGFVYLPGSINLKPFKMLQVKSFEEDMEINFMGAVRTLKVLLPKFSEGASAVFFSTVAVKQGMPFHTSVAAAKGALEGFVRSMAAEYAPKYRFNLIAPSLTDTPLAEKLLNNDTKREKMAERHPLKRVGTPDDIAALAAFLLSDESGWITGQTIGIDGGLSTLNVS